MNRTQTHTLAAFVAVLLLTCTYSHADDRFRTQILKRFPQLDTNGDGVLSDSEAAIVTQKILKRFPDADQDGDGVLSESERQALMKMAANKGKRSKAKNAESTGKVDPKIFLGELGLKSELDIEYRTNTAQQRNKLDFIYPKKKVYDKAPLFIYIHGGGNTGGTKGAIYKKGNLIIEQLTDAGIAVATIDYRVFSQGEELGFQHLFQDCKDALRFLAKNSERFGIDPHKMVTWGTSAGGSKSLICALTANDFLPGEVNGSGTDHTVVGAISFYGVTTMVVEDVWEKRKNRSKAELIMKPNSGLSTDEIRRLVSADQHLKSNSPPILLVHGDSDPTVPVDLSRHLYQRGKETGADVKFIEVKNATHGFRPIEGKAAPSMTWDQTQEVVIKQVLDWVK